VTHLPPVLRPATLADAAAVADVYLASHKRFVAFAPLAHDDDDVRAWIAGTVLPAGGTWVAEVAGRVVAMLNLSHGDDGVDWITHLYVHPSHVALGIGTALLDLALQRCRRPMRLYTFEANAGARRFYERHGFVVIARGDGSGNEERCPDLLYERTT
jgi:GNAT superfamily N-acetyltransferase